MESNKIKLDEAISAIIRETPNDWDLGKKLRALYQEYTNLIEKNKIEIKWNKKSTNSDQ
jgi:hypothetical protein